MLHLSNKAGRPGLRFAVRTLRSGNKGSMTCLGEQGLHPHSGGTSGVLCSELSRQGDTELALTGRLKQAIGFAVVVGTYCTAPAEFKFGYICRYMEHDKATNIKSLVAISRYIELYLGAQDQT